MGGTGLPGPCARTGVFLMLISHRYKFILLSRYKCASTTIRAVFKDYADITGTQHYPYYHHTHLVPLKKHFQSMGWNWTDYFVFTSMRNPWKMVASLYSYGLPDARGRYWWERHWDEVSRDIYKPEQRAVPADMPEFSDWVLGADFSRFKLEPFINDETGQRAAHYIVPVENLAPAIYEVAAKIGAAIATIPRLNPTAYREFKVEYNRAAYRRVRREFALDIALGGYDPSCFQRLKNIFAR